MPTSNDPSSRTTLVVGASRGLGRGIATAFAAAGAPVIGVARTASGLEGLAATAGTITTRAADASDPSVAGSLLDGDDPDDLGLGAGRSPPMRPVQPPAW